MKVTDEQLDKAAQALRLQRNPGARPWELTTEALKDGFRSEVRGVLDLIPDATEPLVGKRRFTVVSQSDEYCVYDSTGQRARLVGFSQEKSLAQAMADAAERWHRAQKAKERKRWHVKGDALHVALGPNGERRCFYKPLVGASSTDIADFDFDGCAAYISEMNARLDAEEGRNG